MPEAINLIRTILIALLMTLATQAGANSKKYGKKECNEILSAINLLFSTELNLWAELVKKLYRGRDGLGAIMDRGVSGQLQDNL